MRLQVQVPLPTHYVVGRMAADVKAEALPVETPAPAEFFHSVPSDVVVPVHARAVGVQAVEADTFDNISFTAYDVLGLLDFFPVEVLVDQTRVKLLHSELAQDP
ncbi:hypothetical protein [Streptomyces sp. CoH17]|uniref:hypothetical protein n=1 Tax=Streptomyces sp. CoH17 TaxID=2992806 RepID=UPI00227021DF|nr:hypothetical protein [Streptomyces sp. CoH17]